MSALFKKALRLCVRLERKHNKMIARQFISWSAMEMNCIMMLYFLVVDSIVGTYHQTWLISLGMLITSYSWWRADCNRYKVQLKYDKLKYYVKKRKAN